MTAAHAFTVGGLETQATAFSVEEMGMIKHLTIQHQVKTPYGLINGEVDHRVCCPKK